MLYHIVKISHSDDALFCIFAGEKVRELVAPETRSNSSNIDDMFIYEDTLIAPCYQEKTVLFYKLCHD